MEIKLMLLENSNLAHQPPNERYKAAVVPNRSLFRPGHRISTVASTGKTPKIEKPAYWAIRFNAD